MVHLLAGGIKPPQPPCPVGQGVKVVKGHCMLVLHTLTSIIIIIIITICGDRDSWPLFNFYCMSNPFIVSKILNDWHITYILQG